MDPYAEEKYGYPYLQIHRADYHRILVDEARRLGVKIELGSSVTEIDFQDATVQLRGKPSFHANVLIGCDGLKSICRETLLGRSDPPLLTGDLAYRIVIAVEDMQGIPELKDLIKKPAIHYWLGPRGHVVLYFLQRGSLCNVVLLTPDDLPEFVDKAKANVQELRDTFRGWDPRLRALTELVQETAKWRLQNSEEMETWTHPAGKFVLLGDACHATLPYLYVRPCRLLEDHANTNKCSRCRSSCRGRCCPR